MGSIAFVLSIPISLAITTLAGIVLGSRSTILLGIIAALVMLSSMATMLKIYERSVLPKWTSRATDVASTWVFEAGLVTIVLSLAIIATGIWFGIDLFEGGKQVIGSIIAIAMLLLLTVDILLRVKSSPWYRGPEIVASPDGIKLRKNFVPWGEVKNVTSYQGRSGSYVVIETSNDAGLYGLDGERKFLFIKRITAPAAGALPESIAHYLNARAKAQQALIAARTPNPSLQGTAQSGRP